MTRGRVYSSNKPEGYRVLNKLPIYIGPCDWCGSNLYAGRAEIVAIKDDKNRVVCPGKCKEKATAKWCITTKTTSSPRNG